ncbi:hypothetical protein TREMEDRAFT_63520 [Tremella mesenterica DSM 1558]|uniref:uncharacterized protein n=1 Tax=Tremella mesenterica (strain ATCC 24925 / CBS 8224 / DSM 1558 / NBRC 9311 / NRRL Y-6157 / RJB 2259-6 / UBC 559-6) TaxID=578456 RepID=UPI0003F49D39|nr:uncharacterized protein TREMEDRAFT_63520 [Tremella mesenterica DSM 1558]EIW68350.1 hypothetical protein TREMEDRAFT_63520 [Tremella mesenterica DSM 1558]
MSFEPPVRRRRRIRPCQFGPGGCYLRPRFLEKFPPELLIQIALYLDKRTACALAVTCKAATVPAELAIYERISLTTTSCNRPCSLTIPGKLDKSSLPILRATFKGYPDSREDAANSVLTISQDVTEFLKEKTSRHSASKELVLDYDPLVPAHLRDLLETVKVTLTTLRFEAPLSVLPVILPNGFIPLSEVFESLSTPLYRLRILNLVYEEIWDVSLRAMLKKMPELRELHLTPMSPWCDGWCEWKPAGSPIIKGDWPKLGHLHKLEIEDMNVHFQDMVLALIQSANQLSYVKFTDIMKEWDLDQAGNILQLLGEKSSVKFLGIPYHLRPILGKTGLFQSVEMISEGDDGGDSDIFLNDIYIPPLPNLKRLFKRVRPTETPFVLTQEDPLHPLQNHLKSNGQMISDALFQQIVHAPQLEMIQFVPTNDGEKIDYLHETVEEAERHGMEDEHPLWGYWGSDEAIEKNDRVILIRSYTDSTERELVHCRGYQASVKHMLDRLCLFGGISICRAFWTDFTSYKSHQVPYTLLRRVYSYSGMKTEWFRPGRGMKLSDESWNLLDKWEEAGFEWPPKEGLHGW